MSLIATLATTRLRQVKTRVYGISMDLQRCLEQWLTGQQLHRFIFIRTCIIQVGYLNLNGHEFMNKVVWKILNLKTITVMTKNGVYDFSDLDLNKNNVNNFRIKLKDALHMLIKRIQGL